MIATSNAATVTSTKTFDRTARENRLAVLAHRDEHNLGMKALTGNTWPLKSMLYAYGSLWNKEAKALEVPEHVHAECQAAIDGYAAAHPKTPKAAKVDRPAKVVTPKPEPKATPAPAPATGIPVGTFAKRIANLGDLTDQVVTDLLANGHVTAAAEVVKALAGFNLAHKALEA